MIPWGRDESLRSAPSRKRDGKRPAVDVPQSELAPAGATFGPWADHESRCKCTVCR